MLAVDLGLRTGFAWFGRRGQVLAYRSQHFGTRSALRGGAREVLREREGTAVAVLEGDRTLARIWAREAERSGIVPIEVRPETWRERLLHRRERRSGARAKQAAGELAEQIIHWGDAPAINGELRHDTAEALCIGLWGLLAAGWIDELPAGLDPRRR